MAVHRLPDLSGNALYATFPFLPGAEALVEDFGASVGGLLTDRTFDRCRALGRQRILAAVDEPTAAPAAEELARSNEAERYLSFLYARLLLSSLGPKGALRRWAVAEAKGASGRFHVGDTAALVEVARRLGHGFEATPKGVRVAAPDYLRLSAALREAEFRLVQQRVGRGWVELPPDRGARILQEAIRRVLAVPLPLEDAVIAAIQAAEGPFLDDIVRRAPAPVARPMGASGPLQPLAFPPCIRHMRRVLQDGENLSHSGRFALAAFLHRAGADPETIVDAYRGAPDFDEGVTRYQVEHITRRDEGRGYEPPTCESLRTHGLCFRDGDPAAREAGDRGPEPRCHDPGLRHPMQFYRGRTGAAGSAR